MRFKGFINEGADANFFETASCIGVICGKPLSDKLKTFLDAKHKKDEDITEELVKLLSEVQSLVGHGGYDWNTSGVSIIKRLGLSDPVNVGVCFSLIVGMNEFMQDIGYHIVGQKPYFIHGGIEEYYSKEIETIGVTPIGKKNTADCIICSSDHHSLMKDLLGSEPDKNLKYMQTPSGIKFIQVSLKKSEGGAQLGKVTKVMKGLFNLSTPASARALFTSNPETPNTVSEGLWDKIVAVASHIMSLTKGFIQKFKHKFGKVNKKYISQFEKGMGINEETGNIQDTTSAGRLLTSITTNPLRATSLVNNEIKKLQEMVRNIDVPIKVDIAGSFSITTKTEAFHLVGNYLTIKAIQELVSDASGLQKNVVRIVGDMYFGNTKLPMWKVFGYLGKKSYHYMGTLDVFVTNKHLPSIDIMGVRMNKGYDCYTITIYMLEDVGEHGKEYIQFRTGTNSSSAPSFIIEGTSPFGPVPMDKPLIEVM